MRRPMRPPRVPQGPLPSSFEWGVGSEGFRGGVTRDQRCGRMGSLFYRVGLQAVLYCRTQALRQVVIHGERAARPGGYVLACTHVSHVEPFIVSCLIPRQVFWMARIEFYRFRPFAWVLRGAGAFPVNRSGVSVKAIRMAIRIAARGDVMGIFPEGGCVKGAALAFRGGPIKQGVATVAHRAQVPVVPVVVLGTDRLTSIYPWLPARRGQVWVAFGAPVDPPAPVPRRERRRVRRAFGDRVARAFVETYQDLLERAKLRDDMTH